MSPRAGLDGLGKSRPTGIRSLDHPAHSKSLYRLSHPRPHVLGDTKLSTRSVHTQVSGRPCLGTPKYATTIINPFGSTCQSLVICLLYADGGRRAAGD